jgi:hypothetical protein
VISAKVIADSVNPDGDRLVTVEGVFNRYLLAEFNTHRVFSRNSASSRAIPVQKVMKQVWSDPALPIHWGENQMGMQARDQLQGWRLWTARRLFLWARIPVLVFVWFLTKLKLHKQVANRLLEPWVWHTLVFSGTEFENFFKLRLHPDAQPEFQEFARCCRVAIDASTPRQLEWGQWHLPYVSELDKFLIALDTEGEDVWFNGPAKVSTACCARTSYVRQNDRKSVAEDVAMCDRLSSSGHWSPFEHPARAERGQHGNFTGFKQLRKFFPGEDGTNK